MSDLKGTQVIIIQTPAKARFECPYCEEEINMSYTDFESQQLSSYFGDWDNVECPECGKSIEIDDVDWS